MEPYRDWEKSASSSQFSSTSKDIDRLDYEAFEKKNPERATYYSAEKIYSEVNKLPKDDRAGRAAKLQEFRNRGYNTEEINQAIITISKLEKEGMTKTDRELLLFSPDVRAKKIIDRFEEEVLKHYEAGDIGKDEAKMLVKQFNKTLNGEKPTKNKQNSGKKVLVVVSLVQLLKILTD